MLFLPVSQTESRKKSPWIFASGFWWFLVIRAQQSTFFQLDEPQRFRDDHLAIEGLAPPEDDLDPFSMETDDFYMPYSHIIYIYITYEQ